MTPEEATELFIKLSKEAGVPDEWIDPVAIEADFRSIFER